MKYSKLGRIFGLSFLGLALLASIPPITGDDPFLALPLFILAAPWVFLLEPLVNSLGYVQWYGKFSGSVDTGYLYSFFATLGMLPGVFINAGILYFIGALFSNAPNKEGVGNGAISQPPGTVNRAWRKFNIFFWLFLLLPLLSLAIPIEAAAGNVAITYLFATIGISIGRIGVLSYFGYAITQNKRFLMLGLLGALSLSSGGLGVLCMFIGYIILLRAKKKLVQS